MPENIGSMEVTYSVAVDQAIRNLDKYNASIKKNENTFKKQSKTEATAAKKSGIASKAIASGMAVAATAITVGIAAIAGGLLLVTAGLYGLMKASSYASIYSTQFGAIIQQVANTFMEKTGLNVVLEDAVRAFQVFADTFGEHGFLVALLGLINEFKAWSWEKWLSFKADPGKILNPIKKIWSVFVELAKGAWEFLKTEMWPSLVNFWNKKLKPAIISSFSGAWTFVRGLLPQWILDIIDWAIKMGSAIYNQDWQGVWDAVIEPFEWAWDKFKDTKLGGMITDFLDKVKEYAPEIQAAIETLIDWADVGKEIWKGIWSGILDGIGNWKNYAPAIPGGPSPYGGWGAEKSLHSWDQPGFVSPKSGEEQLKEMQGGSYQFGGPVKDTGIKLLHAGEYVVPKGGSLVGGSGSSDTYNISPVINIATQSGSGMAGDISRQVSKAIADEIRRITKV